MLVGSTIPWQKCPYASFPGHHTAVLTQHDPRVEFRLEHRGGRPHICFGSSTGLGPLLLTLVLRSLHRRQVLRTVDREENRVGRVSNTFDNM